MKKAFLSAASVVAALALPGLPAMAQTNEITIGITVVTTGPWRRSAFPNATRLSSCRRRSAASIKVIVLDDGGDPTWRPPMRGGS